MIVAIHLAVLQHFSGVNAIAVYGGRIIGTDIPSLKLNLPVLINLTQVLAALSASYLLKKIGRKNLL
jgi:hypothetical protein